MIIMTTTMQKPMMIMMRMTMTMSGRLPGPWSPGAKRGLMRWRGMGRQGDHHHHLHLCDHTDNGGYGNGDVIMSYSELIMMIWWCLRWEMYRSIKYNILQMEIWFAKVEKKNTAKLKYIRYKSEMEILFVKVDLHYKSKKSSKYISDLSGNKVEIDYKRNELLERMKYFEP